MLVFTNKRKKEGKNGIFKVNWYFNYCIGFYV